MAYFSEECFQVGSSCFDINIKAVFPGIPDDRAGLEFGEVGATARKNSENVGK